MRNKRSRVAIDQPFHSTRMRDNLPSPSALVLLSAESNGISVESLVSSFSALVEDNEIAEAEEGKDADDDAAKGVVDADAVTDTTAV
jgi:hypothetical protein